jgi:hypothetical protein
MSTITFHHDAGHGWYEVPLADVEASGAEISSYSYVYARKGVAYLEEDCDITRFVEAIGGRSALQERYGDIASVYDGDDSYIREMRRYDWRNIR